MSHVARQQLLAFCLQGLCAWFTSTGMSVHKGCRATGGLSSICLYNDAVAAWPALVKRKLHTCDLVHALQRMRQDSAP
jgi:hypothetical protein